MLLRNRARRTVLVLTGFTAVWGLAAYGAWSALEGQNGLKARADLDAEIARATADYETLKRERLRLEDRNARLGNENLDLDLLDERARSVLGKTGADEFVIVPPAEREGR